jgi:hypothetical protein
MSPLRFDNWAHSESGWDRVTLGVKFAAGWEGNKDPTWL